MSHETRIQLKSEGIAIPDYLADFDEDSNSKISDDLKSLGGRVIDLAPRAIEGDTIPEPPFTIKGNTCFIKTNPALKFKHKGIRTIGARFNSQEYKDASASVLPAPIMRQRPYSMQC